MITGFGTTLVVATALFGIYNTWRAETDMSTSMRQALALQAEFTQVNVGFKTQVQEWKNVLIRGHDEAQREKYWGKFLKKHELVQKGAAELARNVGDAEIAQQLNAFKTVHSQLLPLYTKGLEAFVDSDFDHRTGDKAVKGIDRKPGEMLLDISNLLSKKMLSQSEQRSADEIKITLVLLALSIIIALAVFLVMVKNIIVAPAQKVASDLSRMAQGDFTQPIVSNSTDELGQVASSAAILKDDIGSIVNQINDSVYKLSTSAEEMAHITEQSNQSANQQKLETDQVATAMNQMTATVHEVAQNAQLAAESATQASNEVNTGQGVVNESINAISKLVQQVETAADVIHALENDSVEIGSVLEVIRGIAEQTNLLALNAAIEAARAGEQGRGFAVVADEVRTLASRTQQSTEEIQSMIEKLQSGAQQAVEAMNQSRSQADVTRDTAAKAGEVLTSITASVTNINDMNTLIASSADEQNAVAEEINRSIVNISQSAEVASQGAAHTAETSEALRNVAEELKHVISRLHV